MYVTKQQADNLVEGWLEHVNTFIGGHNEYLSDLSDEDDWSFVVKAHALIESVVTRMLTSTLGDERLHSIVERLPLSDSKIGKTATAKALGLLYSDQLRFIRWFSTLRNDLVHKLENQGFSFHQRIAELDKNQRKAWADAICWTQPEKSDCAAYRELALTKPKIALRLSIFQLVALCEVATRQARSSMELEAAAQLTTSKRVQDQENLIDRQAILIAELREPLEKHISPTDH